MTTQKLLGYCLILGITAVMPAFADDDNEGGSQTLLVDDNKVECPTARYTRIQDAVNAAPKGATIRVCPGTYHEQVAINKSVRIVGDNGAIVMPSPVITNSTDLYDGRAIAAVILVQNASEVYISGLIVDGANNGISGCVPDLMGIYYRNASGTVATNTVRNMKLSQPLNGCQSGEGIFVQSGLGTSQVTIDTNSVHDYQKNGITGNEKGTKVTVKNNVVTGLGPTTGAAQNGIQIGFGAAGSVDSNISANHVYSPCTITSCGAIATDILIVQSDDVEIMRNIAGRSQSGVYVQANNGEVHDNNVFDTLVFDGIAFVGNNNEAQTNRVTKSDEAGVFVQGRNNQVIGNTIQDAPIGVYKFAGSTGTVVQENKFINTPITELDPSRQMNSPSPHR